MSFYKDISEWIGGNTGKFLGGLVGFVVGILLFTIGFMKTLVILLLIAVGYFIGKSRDEKTDIIEAIADIFRRRG
jgi:uncharacterized membrane protein